jgi:hypothetical protein
MRILLVILLVLATIWLAGDLVLGAVAAPGVFSFAPPKGDGISRAVAGGIFGEIIARWTMVVDVSLQVVVPGLLLVLTGAAISLRRRGAAVLCVLAVAGLLGVHTWSRSVSAEVRAAAPPSDESKPYTSEQQAAFVALHYSSERLYAVECFLLLLIVAGAGVALVRRDRVETSAPQPVR